jgi:enamine deaminase RidA (YjgF/YER057c/UK114 family)
MHIFEKKIKDLDLNIPDMAIPIANYVPYKIFDKTLYVSGQAPIKEGSIIYKGKVGEDITEEEGIKAAEICCINIIAVLKSAINGDWDLLDGFIKLGGFVNCNVNFTNHPQIINGASDLLVKIFSEQGKHTRFAVGSNSLPMNISVEIDAVIKLR